MPLRAVKGKLARKRCSSSTEPFLSSSSWASPRSSMGSVIRAAMDRCGGRLATEDRHLAHVTSQAVCLAQSWSTQRATVETLSPWSGSQETHPGPLE